MNPAEEYILNQSEPFKTILSHIQILIETSVPSVVLKYKYKIPFYYLFDKPFCYLNVTKGYVDVGFWKANQINIHLDHLVTDGRKVMKSLRYRALEDIDNQVAIDILNEAKGLYE
ncbi:DUF1801 domain-containing protein [Aquimarina pacifica]|uniref:DUF1801 domain-containing protein n=1 Tax=Aquimarina pacifica TaxID=1296415 RepID=UPI000471D46A|nr:DUF1801 domain-containing protein [Aquimarina pacifica]